MKIHHVNRIGAINPYQKQQELKSMSRGVQKGQKDEISISNDAKQLAAENQAHTDRIEHLQRSVADGTYRIDTKRLAEKLLPYFR